MGGWQQCVPIGLEITRRCASGLRQQSTTNLQQQARARPDDDSAGFQTFFQYTTTGLLRMAMGEWCG